MTENIKIEYKEFPNLDELRKKADEETNEALKNEAKK